MTTALDIIKAASRKIHVLGRGQSLTNDESQDALDALNNMLGSWSVEGGLVIQDTQETFSLTGAQSYTIGSGGDFNTTVPYAINNAYATSGGLDYYLDSVGVDDYNSLPLKQTGSIPNIYYFNYGYPLATIFIYPVAPSGYTLTINSQKRLTEFAALTTEISLSPEYKEALIYNLAIRLAPDYEKEPSMTVMRLAHQSKENVFAANTRANELVSVPAYGVAQRNGFNIYKGNNV